MYRLPLASYLIEYLTGGLPCEVGVLPDGGWAVIAFPHVFAPSAGHIS